MINNFNREFIDSLFDTIEFIDIGNDIRIMKTIIPDLVWEEVTRLERDARSIKDHPLSSLRYMYNQGNNSYQYCIPSSDLEKSFVMPYIIFAGQKYIAELNQIDYVSLHRNVILKQLPGHHEGYDFWFNYSNIGDTNPIHKHGGSVSSVIYVSNTEDMPTKFYNGYCFYGKPKEMVLFPAKLGHQVEENKIGERVTAAYNLILRN